MTITLRSLAVAAATMCLLPLATPAQAEVVKQDENGFVVRDSVTVAVEPSGSSNDIASTMRRRRTVRVSSLALSILRYLAPSQRLIDSTG